MCWVVALAWHGSTCRPHRSQQLGAPATAAVDEPHVKVDGLARPHRVARLLGARRDVTRGRGRAAGLAKPPVAVACLCGHGHASPATLAHARHRLVDTLGDALGGLAQHPGVRSPVKEAQVGHLARVEAVGPALEACPHAPATDRLRPAAHHEVEHAHAVREQCARIAARCGQKRLDLVNRELLHWQRAARQLGQRRRRWQEGCHRGCSRSAHHATASQTP
eukprot:scaffold130051_cov63-Phaeocystis_antarctica.AAC.2